jgi:hypothetical protein
MSEIAKQWIDGEWPGSGTISESVNPATGAVLGQWADGGALNAGLVVLPLNPQPMAPEPEYHLGDSAAAPLIGFEGMHAEAVKACKTTGVPLYLARWRLCP